MLETWSEIVVAFPLPSHLLHFSTCNQEIVRREQEGQLDEGFLAEVSAQLRQVSPSLLILT